MFKNKKGFTLIEVIIVIAVVGIMSAVSIVSFANSKKNTELETAADEVVSVLREAQNYSLTGKNITESGCGVYQVIMGTGANVDGYRLINGTCSQSDYVLKNKIRFNSVVTITFSSPHAVRGANNRALIRNSSGSFYTICVNSAGLITRTKGNVACP